jgi:hypothetical protein
MTTPLNTLIDAACSYPTAECFVVSVLTYQALEREAEDYLVERTGHVSTIRGMGQMTVCGVAVTRTRNAYLNGQPFIELHHRPGHEGYPEIVRIL